MYNLHLIILLPSTQNLAFTVYKYTSLSNFGNEKGILKKATKKKKERKEKKMHLGPKSKFGKVRTNVTSKLSLNSFLELDYPLYYH